MLWMETYLFYCSVRLGVIIVGVLTLLQLLIPAILFLALGIRVLDPVVELFQNDDHYKKNYFVIKAIDWIENSSENFMILMHVYLCVHMATCIMAIYGAFKLQKCYLVPLSILEFIRVVYCLTWHIVLMIVLKKILNLGVLIAFTLMGGFFILYLGYNWASCVALYQIITLIKSQRYQALYGDDPFRPIVAVVQQQQFGQFSYGTIENVRVLTTPNSKDIEEQKLRNQRKTIISVLPANYARSERLPLFVSKTKKKSSRRQLQNWQLVLELQQQEKQKNRQQQMNSQQLYENDYALDYGDFQWAELPGAATTNRNRALQQNWYWR